MRPTKRVFRSRCHHYCWRTSTAQLLLLLRPLINRRAGLTIPPAACLTDTARTLPCCGQVQLKKKTRYDRCHYYHGSSTSTAELLLLPRPLINRRAGLTIPPAACFRDTARTMLWTGTSAHEYSSRRVGFRQAELKNENCGIFYRRVFCRSLPSHVQVLDSGLRLD